MKASLVIVVVSLTLVIGEPSSRNEENALAELKLQKKDVRWYYACKYRGGKIAVEEDCGKFYDCKKKKIESCHHHQLFDSTKLKCEPKEKVDCEERKKPHDNDSSSESKEDKKNIVCPKKEGKFPHPDDCSKYYKCKSWKEQLVSCPKNKLFDPNRKKCEPEDKVHCGNKKNPYDPDSETDFHCPRESGNFPLQTNCAKYYSCHHHLARIRTCHDGELFDVDKHKCRKHTEVSCRDRINPYEPEEREGDFECPFPDGEFVDRQNCHKYYLCRNNVAKWKTCARDELFEVEKRRCLPKNKVKCDRRKRPTEREFECPNAEKEDHAAEHDCSLYYSCTAGRPRLLGCPAQQLFDRSKGCREAELVDCQSRFNPYEEEREISDEVDFDCPRPNGYYAHPDDCRSYYNCHNGTATLDSCPSGQMFDLFKRRCANEKSVDCGHPVYPLDDSRHHRYRYRYRWCPRARGFFHHFTHCGYYYHCWHRRPSFRRCFSGHFYDIFRNRCYPGSLVDCGDRQDKDKDDDNQGFTCPSSKGRYPVETNCSAFYQCNQKKWDLKYCPKGQLFDVQKKRCEKHYKVDCGDRFDPDGTPDNRDEFVCPTSRGNYPNSEDCSRYFSCNRGKATLKVCPVGHLYDANRGDCEKSYRVDCGERPYDKKNDEEEDDDLKCPSANGNYPHETDCRKYYSCSNGLARERKCRSNQLFDVDRGVCEPDYRVDCGARIDDSSSSSSEENSSEKRYKCPTSGGNHPHSDCSMYYHCSNKKFELKKCPDGQLYEVVRRGCDRWDKVDCGARRDPKDLKTTQMPTKRIEITTHNILINNTEISIDNTKKEDISTILPISSQSDFSQVTDEIVSEVITEGINNITDTPIGTRYPVTGGKKVSYNDSKITQTEIDTTYPITGTETASHGFSDFTETEIGTRNPVTETETVSQTGFKEITETEIGTRNPVTEKEIVSQTGFKEFTETEIGTRNPVTETETVSQTGFKEITETEIDTKNPVTETEIVSQTGFKEITETEIGTRNPVTETETVSQTGFKEITETEISTRNPVTEKEIVSQTGFKEITETEIGTRNPVTETETVSQTGFKEFTETEIGTRNPVTEKEIVSQTGFKEFTETEIGTRNPVTETETVSQTGFKEITETEISTRNPVTEKEIVSQTGFKEITETEIGTRNPVTETETVSQTGFKEITETEISTRNPVTEKEIVSQTGFKEITETEIGTRNPVTETETVSQTGFKEITETEISTRNPVTEKEIVSQTGFKEITETEIGTRNPVTETETVSQTGFKEFTETEIGTRNPVTEKEIVSQTGFKEFTETEIGTRNPVTETETVSQTSFKITETETSSRQPITNTITSSQTAFNEITGREIGRETRSTSLPFTKRITTLEPSSKEITRDEIDTGTSQSFITISKSDFTETSVKKETDTNQVITEEISTSFPESNRDTTNIKITTNPSNTVSNEMITDSIPKLTDDDWTAIHPNTGNKRITSTEKLTESETSTTQIVTTIKPDGVSECPEPNGLFPHPNPHKFVHCSNWTPHIKDCPGTLVFNKKLKICSWSLSFSQDIPLPPGVKKDCN